MALDINYTLVPGSGNFFKAPTGAPQPADLFSVTTPWEPLGHTSIDDILSFASEGGDQTVLGTFQNRNARTTYSARSEGMDIVLQQFDEAALKVYYGSNMVTIEDGKWLGVPQTPTPVEGAYLAVFYDGEKAFGVYAAKAEYFRGDDVDINDTENFAGLPIRVTPLIHETNTWAFAVTPLDWEETP